MDKMGKCLLRLFKIEQNLMRKGMESEMCTACINIQETIHNDGQRLW